MLNSQAPNRRFAAVGNGVSSPPSGPRPVSALTLPSAGSVLDAEALQRLSELDPTGANRLLERVFQAFEASALRLLPQMHEPSPRRTISGVRHGFTRSSHLPRASAPSSCRSFVPKSKT